jgi:hypothetical protein
MYEKSVVVEIIVKVLINVGVTEREINSPSIFPENKAILN